MAGGQWFGQHLAVSDSKPQLDGVAVSPSVAAGPDLPVIETPWAVASLLVRIDGRILGRYVCPMMRHRRQFQIGAASVLGVIGITSNGVGFAGAAVGDAIDVQIRTGITDTDFFGGYGIHGFGTDVCVGTVLDPNDAGQSFRVEVDPACVDGYLVTGSGYGTLDEREVVIAPFEVTIDGDSRSIQLSTAVLVDSTYSVTTVGTSINQDGSDPASVVQFSTGQYPCATVRLEVAADDGSYAGLDTGCSGGSTMGDVDWDFWHPGDVHAHASGDTNLLINPQCVQVLVPGPDLADLSETACANKLVANSLARSERFDTEWVIFTEHMP